MILTPDLYGKASVADLFSAAARGHVAVDHRFLHAILDNMPANLPAVIEYANRSREGERYDVSVDLMRIFAVHPVPEAIPFLIREIRRFPDEIPDEMSEAMVRIGKPAVDPLLEVAAEFKRNRDVMFVVAATGVGDPRVNALIEEIEAEDEDEGDYLRGVWHAGEVRPEEPPYDIWKEYDETAAPDFDGLPREEVLEFLACPAPDLRRAAAASFHKVELDEEEVRLLLGIARNDSDSGVRSEAWEVLRDHTGNKEVEAAMRARIDDPATPEDEHVSLCLGLKDFAGEPAIRAHVVKAYENPATRARALDAMWNSFDTSFAEFVKRHLDDDDTDIRRAVVWGIGAFNLKEDVKRLEPLFTHENLRDDALYNYALVAPARTNRFDLNKLGHVIEDLAGGLDEEEAEIVHRAFDSRLVEAGKAPVFSEWAAVEDDEEEPPPAKPAAPTAGRNDPCPCGSGKKFKKCCGK